MTSKSNSKIYRFFIFTFLLSWISWSPFYFQKEVSELWLLPGAWSPTIVALILAFREKGKYGIRVLFRKLLIWKVSLKYYLFSIFGILIVGILSVLIFILFGGNLDVSSLLEGTGFSSDQLGLVVLLFPLLFLINTLFGGPIAEELGWRGYAQGILQQRFSPNFTGLVIGFLWSIWHLPLILFYPEAVGNMPIWAYIPLMTAMGIIFSWLYNKTNGSVLLAILLHGGLNFAHGFLGSNVFNNRIILIIQVAFIILLASLLSLNNKQKIESTNVHISM